MTLSHRRPFLFLLGLVFLAVSPRVGAQTPPAPAANLAAYPTANGLWEHVHQLFLQVQSAQSPEDRARVDREMRTALQAFMAQYPNDPRVLNAKMLATEAGADMIRLKLPDAPSPEVIAQAFDQMSNDPAVPAEKRAEIKGMQIAQAMRAAAESHDPKAWAAADTRIAAFQKEFGTVISVDGKLPVVVELRGMELDGLKATGQTAQYETLLKKLSTDPQPQLAQMASGQMATDQKINDLKAKPLQLKFTSVSGAPIDLATLRGKVVLVDFWATWCPPCREEIPEVVAAYQKYHSQGFEILGISLDQDKKALVAYTKEHGMAWPQYFDGKGWGNAISSGFGINLIPAMWLVDKKGMLVTEDGRTNLDEQVDKLLKAP